jgi:hypothetical protein
MPPTPTRWTRLEGNSRSLSLDPGLRAEIHDPLWMLARQWQMAEFVGDDVGSPVYASVRLDCTHLTRYAPGAIPNSWFQPGGSPAVAGAALPRGIPLETLVERGRVHESAATRPRLAAEAGLQFLRLLRAAGAGAHAAEILSHFPLQVLAGPAAIADPETQRFLSVMGGRAPDGDLLAAILQVIRSTAPGTVAAPLQAKVTEWQTWYGALSAADRPKVDQACTTWLNWYANLFAEPETPAAGSAWVPERLEYGAMVAAPTPQGEVVLTIGEYQQGGLDWWSFDVLSGGSLGAVRSDLTSDDLQRENVHRRVIPAPVRFPGMPASRYWEFEDARVDFGSVAAGPQQLAHLLLVDFAMLSADDWFVIPIEVPVGSFCQTRWLVVTDTFGQRTLIPSARAVDAAAQTQPQSTPAWDLFRLSVDPRPVSGGTRSAPDALLVPPTLGPSLFGTPLEEVTVLRDEVADMAWAVERKVESGVGRPFDRVAAFSTAQADQSAAVSASAGADPSLEWTYQIRTRVPDYWLPLFPVRVSSSPGIQLQRGGTPLGRILQPAIDPLLIRNEEVPREGARFTSAFQYARWIDGGSFLWLMRTRGAGRGEGSSGLRFDVLQPIVPPSNAAPAMQLGVRSRVGIDSVVRRLFS